MDFFFIYITWLALTIVLPRVPAGDWFCPSCRAPASKSESAASASTVAGKKPKHVYSFFAISAVSSHLSLRNCF